MNPFSNSRGDAAAVSPRGEAPDENTVVDKMVAHPDAIAQKGSGREQAGGVHRQDPDALFPPPILGGHPIGEAALSRSSSAGHSDDMSSAGMRINRLEDGLHLRVAVLN